MSGIPIGKLAEALSLSIDTIRYYEKIGLLPTPARSPSGYRDYSERDLVQLTFVRDARRLGFSIDEVLELLTVDEIDEGRAHEILERKMGVIDCQMAALQRWRALLEKRANAQVVEGECKPSIVDLFSQEARPIPMTVHSHDEKLS